MKKILFCLLAFSIVSCSSNDLYLYESYQSPTYSRKYRAQNNSGNSYIEFYKGKNYNSASIVIDGVRINLIKDKYSPDEKYSSYDLKYEITLKGDYLYLNNEGNYTEYYGMTNGNYGEIPHAYDRVENRFINPKNREEATLISSLSMDEATLRYKGEEVELFRTVSGSGVTFKSRNKRLTVSLHKGNLYIENSFGRIEEFIDADQYYSFIYDPRKNIIDSKFSIYDSPITKSKDKVIYNFKTEYGDSKVMMITSPSYDVAVVRKDGKEFELYRSKSASGLTYSSANGDVMYTISKGKLYIEQGSYSRIYYDNYTYSINYAK